MPLDTHFLYKLFLQISTRLKTRRAPKIVVRTSQVLAYSHSAEKARPVA